MSSALLAKLKVKPVPKPKLSIDVVIPVAAKKEEVAIKTVIVDKRAENLIDRQAILARIRDSQFKQPKVSKPTEIIIKPPTVVELDILKPKQKAKKIKKKIKLVQKNDIEELPNQPLESKIGLEEEEKKPDAVEDVENIEVIQDGGPMVIKLKKKRVEKLKLVQEGPMSMVIIGDTPLNERITPPKPKVLIRSSDYYLNNRQIFVNFISSLFAPYKEQLSNDKKTFSCESRKNKEISLLTHQKIVRDYINLYTPYRGLLLYHGLGSGKTCSSIAIAEGIKTSKEIIIMTPASLRRNYLEQLKECGDSMFKKNQYWEFVNTRTNPEFIEPLKNALSLSEEYITRQGGAFLVNMKKPSNFDDLNPEQKFILENQLNEMIRFKYKFINYNGLRKDTLDALTINNTINPFDNKVVIIDEAHNFVSRIVNKLSRGINLSTRLYEYLMNAQNVRIVLLSGTPIINYPNEIAILFNILRGKIKTFTFKLNISSDRKINQESIEELFLKKLNTRRLLDYIQYKPTNTTLVVTRNPFGYISSYNRGIYQGVNLNEGGDMNDEEFVRIVTKVLKDENIEVQKGPNSVKVDYYKALPDTLDDFKNYFINLQDNTLKNMDLFKKRILGLTSYFSDIEELMPKYLKSRDFKVIRIPMSSFQFGEYEKARSSERKQEDRNARKKKKSKRGPQGQDIFEDATSTYRIFSRAFCNFVFPTQIVRPMPKDGETLEDAAKKEADEDILDNASNEERIQNVDGRYDADDTNELEEEDREKKDDSYETRINQALEMLWRQRERFLTPDALETYSPKFLTILQNIENPEHRGLNLIYSQFRTLEGIGIMKLVLMANGFAEFKIRKNDAGIWRIDINEDDIGKPTFALYTGTETYEEKEIVRNIFNSEWKYVPSSLVEQLERNSSNNFYGEIIKVLMITSSGAEGIDLKNVRYVHLTESYWHPVRLEQVIGRARRICSHSNLPVELQTVEVFLYLMTFTPEQINSEGSRELRLKDVSKFDRTTPITSDEALYETSNIKAEITKTIMKAVKESAIDCTLISKSKKENLQCFSFTGANPNAFSYSPALTEDQQDSETVVNRRFEKIKFVALTILGTKYAFDKITNNLYDFDSYDSGRPILVGNLEIVNDADTGERMYKINPI